MSPNTVRNYYQILKDTLLGFDLQPWRRRQKRRLVETAKFFLFDIGVANQLNPESRLVAEGSDTYGRAFVHFLINEIRACFSYRRIDLPLTYWRTSSGFEVDVIVGVVYGAAHEFGVTVTITPKQRRFFWAMFKKTETDMWRALALSTTYTIPARPYLRPAIDTRKKVAYDVIGRKVVQNFKLTIQRAK